MKASQFVSHCVAKGIPLDQARAEAKEMVATGLDDDMGLTKPKASEIQTMLQDKGFSAELAAQMVASSVASGEAFNDAAVVEPTGAEDAVAALAAANAALAAEPPLPAPPVAVVVPDAPADPAQAPPPEEAAAKDKEKDKVVKGLLAGLTAENTALRAAHGRLKTHTVAVGRAMEDGLKGVMKGLSAVQTQLNTPRPPKSQNGTIAPLAGDIAPGIQAQPGAQKGAITLDQRGQVAGIAKMLTLHTDKAISGPAHRLLEATQSGEDDDAIRHYAKPLAAANQTLAAL